jgi:hypothetical protein
MRRAFIAAGVAAVLAACSGADTVVKIDGVRLGVDDIPVETEESTIDLSIFRNALNWVIRDEVLTAAAADEFGVVFDAAETEARAADALAGLSPTDQIDPRANLDYFLIQSRVGRNGLLWPQIEPFLPDGVGQNQWAIEQLRSAEVDVDPRYGEWRTDPEPLVYEP